MVASLTDELQAAQIALQEKEASYAAESEGAAPATPDQIGGMKQRLAAHSPDLSDTSNEEKDAKPTDDDDDDDDDDDADEDTVQE